MSRVGRLPVSIPAGVKVEVAGQIVTAAGKQGRRSLAVAAEIIASIEDGKVWIKPRNDDKAGRAMWGTTRNLVNNLVTGIDRGFSISLEIIGVGFRAAADAKTLTLQLGYSHDVVFPIPEGIAIKCEKPTLIKVSGAERQLVGQVAAKIRGFRPPEPYKGKGIKYEQETVLRKEGKKK